jgi:hypothetical protein
MQGRSGTRAGLVYLLAGAALGAAVVIVLWIYSGGKPFGELVGTADVSPATPAAVQPSAPADRAASPAGTGAQLESEPPAVGRSRELQFKKKTAAKRTATAKAKAKAKKSRKKPARRKQVVRVVAPPPSTTADDEEIPVAVVPSPAPSAAPTPPPAPAPAGGGGKPVNRAPASGVGAGEG